MRVKTTFYQPPAVLHEGRRATRIVELMRSGFRRWEARELAGLPADDPALRAMVKQRRNLAMKVFRAAREDNLTEKQTQHRLTRAVADFYLNKVKVKLKKTVEDKDGVKSVVPVDRAGFPHQWRRKLLAINKIPDVKARRREANRVSVPLMGFGDFSDGYPGKGKGDKRMQKARRRAAIRDAKRQGKLRVDILEREYVRSFKLVAESKTRSVKRDMLERQRELKDRLEKAQSLGEEYG